LGDLLDGGLIELHLVEGEGEEQGPNYDGTFDILTEVINIFGKNKVAI